MDGDRGAHIDDLLVAIGAEQRGASDQQVLLVRTVGIVASDAVASLHRRVEAG